MNGLVQKQTPSTTYQRKLFNMEMYLEVYRVNSGQEAHILNMNKQVTDGLDLICSVECTHGERSTHEAYVVIHLSVLRLTKIK